MQTIKPSDFARELKAGCFAWPGGYPKYFVTSDGAALCFPCAKKEGALITSALRDNDTRSGWHVAGVDVNWEDSALFCDHCSKRIESAYAEDEAKAEVQS
jgi:hypothetical protein